MKAVSSAVFRYGWHPVAWRDGGSQALAISASSQQQVMCSGLKRSSPTFLSSLTNRMVSIKCENNHITWPKKEFIDILCGEIEQTSLSSSGNTHNRLKKNIKHDFTQLAGGMERLLSLQSWDEVDVIARKFNLVDPDSVRIVAQQMKKQDVEEVADESRLNDQLDFVKHMSPYLKQAGYSEVLQGDLNMLFSVSHRYGDVELKVDTEQFEFLRIWVFGRFAASKEKQPKSFKEISRKRWKQFGASNEYQVGSDLCHRRVVVASRSRKRQNMIFKCFKDVPVGHFEALVPEAKIHIPFGQRWFWNSFLLVSGVTFFFNFGLWLQSEHKFGYAFVAFIVLSFIVYRARMVYRNVRNRYDIMWKQMLYYKSTSNNSALAMELLYRARGQSFKITLLTYVAALQVAKRNKGSIVTIDQMENQCNTWFEKVRCDFPEREIGTIRFNIGISNLLNMGILCYHDSKSYEVMDVAQSLKKVEKELISLCIEACDST